MSEAAPVCDGCGNTFTYSAPPGYAEGGFGHECVLDRRLTARQMLRLMEVKDQRPIDDWYVLFGRTVDGTWQDATTPSH